MPEHSTIDPSPEAPADHSDGINGSLQVRVYDPQAVWQRLQAARTGEAACDHPAHDLRWLLVLEKALKHRPYLIEADWSGRSVGLLPLSFVSSLLFGRFLVSLPYVNSAGVTTDDPDVAAALITNAIELADELDCRFLELRHEAPRSHPSLNGELTSKVHMRLALPATVDALWDGLKSKVRSQIRKGQRQGFMIHWERHELLPDFYHVFSRRMRDLGTPVFPRNLFDSILTYFADDAEICCVHDGTKPVAAALLIHGAVYTEVPSASSLKAYNSANANMLMYWHLLVRAVERGQRVFDFGRTSRDVNTFRFKKQWGAAPEPAVWQYYVRQGSADALRPDNARYQRLIRIWQRLPVWLTQLIGPWIVRGIP